MKMPRVALVALVALVAVVALSGVSGQQRIPKRPEGVALNAGSASAPLQLSFFVDLLCPYSQRAFPTMQKLADHYGDDKIRVKLHLYPLAFHRNGVLAGTAAQVVKDAAPDQFFKFVQLVWSNMAKFSESVTMDQTENQIIANFASLAEQVGVPKDKFLAGMSNGDIEELIHTSWSYAVSRSVLGTPWFFINDVHIEGDSTWTVEDWQTVLDPLLGVAKPSFAPNRASDANDCPEGQVKCEYLPHKIQCCLPGEHCLPGVGCRC